MRLRRSLHFVPGANEKMMGKALNLSADALIFDLEDSVHPRQNWQHVKPYVNGLMRIENVGRSGWCALTPSILNGAETISKRS